MIFLPDLLTFFRPNFLLQVHLLLLVSQYYEKAEKWLMQLREEYKTIQKKATNDLIDRNTIFVTILCENH